MKKRAFLSQSVSPERQLVQTPAISTEKKESTVKKVEQEIVKTNVSDEGKSESPLAIEENNFEDCNDLVLVEINEEERPRREERSVSPNVRDKLMDFVRPGTSPVVQKVRKSEYNKIG